MENFGQEVHHLLPYLVWGRTLLNIKQKMQAKRRMVWRTNHPNPFLRMLLTIPVKSLVKSLLVLWKLDLLMILSQRL
uniref:Uncharacterized protein n=1 Tax=Brassica campestris TaxID=3711 RepID=A0A3P5ZBT5_BRACM|nr:unnamed protein product [Brassica rapa]